VGAKIHAKRLDYEHGQSGGKKQGKNSWRNQTNGYTREESADADKADLTGTSHDDQKGKRSPQSPEKQLIQPLELTPRDHLPKRSRFRGHPCEHEAPQVSSDA
jgi:hypothetical protein